MKKALFVLIPVALIGALIFLGFGQRINRKISTLIAEYKPHNQFVPTPAVSKTSFHLPEGTITPSKTRTATPTATLAPPPASYMLTDIRHEYQTWNNCGPATTAMALSYYDKSRLQKDIAPYLKPDSEDKNVSPDEVVQFVNKNTDEKAIYALNGNMLLIKQLVSHNIPVMVESWFEYRANDEMGHYELVVGYDDAKGSFTLYDSFRGPNIVVPYTTFDENWKVFDRTFIPIAPKKEDKILDAMLSPYTNRDEMLQQSLIMAQEEIKKNDKDKFAYFNLGTTLSLMNKHDDAAAAFDKARSLQLPWRMLWYQFEIFESYLAVGRYQDVIDLATTNLNQTNNLEESNYYRGRAYELTGRKDLAKQDYQQALKYNKLYQRAADALEVISKP